MYVLRQRWVIISLSCLLLNRSFLACIFRYSSWMICPHHYHNHNHLSTKQFEFVVIFSVSLGLKKESEEIDALASRTRRSEQKKSPASQSNVYHDLLRIGHCLPLLVSMCLRPADEASRSAFFHFFTTTSFNPSHLVLYPLITLFLILPRVHYCHEDKPTPY